MSAKKAYVFAYNAFSAGAWAYMLFRGASALADKPGDYPNLWKETNFSLKVAQTPALLEVVHAAVGLVRSPVPITAVQVASRIWLLWGITNLEPAACTSRMVEFFRLPALAQGINGGAPLPVGLSLSTLLFAWGVTEVIRYSFFATKVLEATPKFLTWLRYSSFIPLYPLGVASELAMVHLALPAIKRDRPLSLSLPNRLNIGVDYLVVCYVILGLYVPGFPKLYFYMLSQRGKALRAAFAPKSKKSH